MAVQILFNVDSGNGLLPNCTKPLPETMLTYQWGSVTLTWHQFHRKCSRYQFINGVWKITSISSSANQLKGAIKTINIISWNAWKRKKLLLTLHIYLPWSNQDMQGSSYLKYEKKYTTEKLLHHPIFTYCVKDKMQRWFRACAEPMRDVVTM